MIGNASRQSNKSKTLQINNKFLFFEYLAYKSLVDLVKESVVPNRKEKEESQLSHMLLTFRRAANSNNGSFDATVVVSVNEFGMNCQTPILKRWFDLIDQRWK